MRGTVSATLITRPKLRSVADTYMQKPSRVAGHRGFDICHTRPCRLRAHPDAVHPITQRPRNPCRFSHALTIAVLPTMARHPFPVSPAQFPHAARFKYSNIVLSHRTSMDDPTYSIAAIQIRTRIVFRFELLDSPVLVYVLPAPNCIKSAARRSLYPVTPILKLAGHDACVSEIFRLLQRIEIYDRFEERASPSALRSG